MTRDASVMWVVGPLGAGRTPLPSEAETAGAVGELPRCIREVLAIHRPTGGCRGGGSLLPTGRASAAGPGEQIGDVLVETVALVHLWRPRLETACVEAAAADSQRWGLQQEAGQVAVGVPRKWAGMVVEEAQEAEGGRQNDASAGFDAGWLLGPPPGHQKGVDPAYGG